jgi:hypothetical protein
MHPSLKKKTTRPTARNLLQQQVKLDELIDCSNPEHRYNG